jgi:tetratricopeptide (TPR) repeat protein
VSLLCKTSVVMFPVVLLLYAWWKRGRVRVEDLKAAGPFFALSLALGLVTIHFQSKWAIRGEELHLGGWPGRIGSAGVAVVFYLFKCVIPVGLMPIYPDWGDRPLGPQTLLCWVAVVAGMWWLFRPEESDVPVRHPYRRAAGLGIGFFLVNLLPVLGFAAMSYLKLSRVADHLCYLPLAGIVGLAGAWAGSRAGVGEGRPAPRKGVAVTLGLIACVVTLAVAARNYAGIFRDPAGFWSYAVQRNPTAPIAMNNLGTALLDEGRKVEAAASYRRAIELDPSFAEAYNNLGNVLLDQGQLAEAARQYQEALRIIPDYGAPQNGLGLALYRAGHFAESLPYFEQAIASNAPLAEPHYNMGLALFRLNRTQEAIAQYREALRLKPAYPEAMNGLADALWIHGEYDSAIELYRSFLRLKPDNAVVQYDLATLLARRPGSRAEAIAHYEAALRIDPQLAAAREALRWLQAGTFNQR